MDRDDLRDARRRTGKSLEKLSARLGVSPSFLSRIERGQRVSLRLVSCEALAQAYGVSAEVMQGIIDEGREERAQ